MVFRDWETAEVFLWEVRSAAPTAELVPARGRKQFQVQNRQNKCLLSNASDAVLPRGLHVGKG